MSGRVIFSDITKHGHFSSQKALAYEVRMTSKPPESQWRKNHVLMAVAESVEEAIAMAKNVYPDDPVIMQVVLKNGGMDLLLSQWIISEEAK